MAERRVSCNHGEGINCLQHGDFNFNNLMFRDEDDGRTSVMIIDWQMTYTGNAGGDLAYLLMYSLDPQMFEMDEQSIKAKYFKMFRQIFFSVIKDTRDEVEEMLEQDYHESLPLEFISILLWKCYKQCSVLTLYDIRYFLVDFTWWGGA